MDWKKITETVTPYIIKAKEYGQKAVQFTEDQLQSTGLFIKTQSEYDTFVTEKRSVLISYDTSSDVAKEVRLFVSIWMTKAFADAATFRFINTAESKDLAKNLNITTPIDMRIRLDGVETFHFTDIGAIKKWWGSPCYSTSSQPSPTGEGVETKEEKVDPLAK